MKIKNILSGFLLTFLITSCAIYKIENKTDDFSGDKKIEMQGNLVSSSFSGDYRFNLIYEEPKQIDDFYLAEIYYKGMGWQFLNGLAIKINGNVKNLSLYNSNNLVTSSGTVKEWAQFKIEKEIITNIINANSVSIKVYGENFDKSISIHDKTKHRFNDFLEVVSKK